MMERWVCPNDRQLALRAKLGTGWSVHTNKFSSFSRGEQLSLDEQEQIMKVIKRAETLENTEMERIGRLVERVENMKKNAMGNGDSQCILCGDEFGLLGASPTYCDDCRKAVCTKCGVDTVNSSHQQLWLCKICSENRELWKRSGAWFFKGIPKYIAPVKKTDTGRGVGDRYIQYNKTGVTANRHASSNNVTSSPRVKTAGMTYNTWSRGGRQSLGDSSDAESSEESEDDISIGRKKQIPGTNTADSVESDRYSLDSSRSNLAYNAGQRDTGHISATESSREDYHDDGSDTDSIGRFSREDSMRSTTESTHLQINPNHPSNLYSHHQYPNTGRQQSRSPASTPDNAGSKYTNNNSQGNDSLLPHPMSGRGTSPSHDHSDASPMSPDSPDGLSLGSLEFTLCYDAVNRTLTCNINRAMNLKAMDSNGLSDPYVKLHLLPGASKSFKLRTKTIHKTLNPEWYETLIFHGVMEDDIRNKTLRVSVLDEDTFGYDFIGEYRLPLRTVKPHTTKEFNVYLEKRIMTEEDDELSAHERGRILISLRYSLQRQQFTVGILRCAGLAAMDSNGYSDPYVKVYLKPDKDKKTKFKTKVKKRTLNPEFNEDFTYNMPQSELAKKTLEITVWDKDIGHNDYIGGVEFSINSRGDRLKHWFRSLKQTNETHTMWHRLDLNVHPGQDESKTEDKKKDKKEKDKKDKKDKKEKKKKK